MSVATTEYRARSTVSTPRDLPRIERFDAFYRDEFPRAVALAYALTGNRAVSEDVAQETLLAAHRHWDRIGTYDQPTAWVRRVLINRATSFHRRRTVEWRAVLRLASRGANTIVPDLEPEDAEVWAAVRELLRRQAQAIALHYVEELSLEEIGEVLGCSPGTVKTHLHRARTRLIGRLGVRYEETT